MNVYFEGVVDSFRDRPLLSLLYYMGQFIAPLLLLVLIKDSITLATVSSGWVRFAFHR